FLDAWSYLIAQSATQSGIQGNQSYAGLLARNPMTSSLSGGVFSLDLFRATQANGVFSFYGTLSLNLSGTSFGITYDPVSAVPEPSTYGLLAGAGLLVVALRRKLSTSRA